MTALQAFIGYAHKSEAVKDRLKINLAPLVRSGLLHIWDDRAILAGADWRAEIDKRMALADVAVFVLDENFLASDFCMDHEVRGFLERHRTGGVLILYVLADHCLWNVFDFIEQRQLLPRDAKPLATFREDNFGYTQVAREIMEALEGRVPKSGGPAEAGLQAEPGSLAGLLEKLPGATGELFGREAEIAQLSAWKNHKGVLLWTAPGGTGKSALVRWWLEQQHWPEGTRFLGTSFYSQGSRNQATSSRTFLLQALTELQVPHDPAASDDQLGRLLAQEAALAPTVLVLDGMEPLQQASEDPKLNGTLKDRGLAVLLESLAKHPGQALCLAGSRLPLSDIGITEGAWFRQIPLGLLPPAGAQALLRQRGLRGSDAEIEKMAQRCGHHPLALILAAEFCHTFLEDSAQAFLARPWQPETDTAHAATVMRWFDQALQEERQTLDRELVHCLGLFDRPAPWGAIMALKEADPIPGLTQALHDAKEDTLLESLARLAQWGLLDADLSRKEPELDAHPLVREHFGAELEANHPEAWQAAHSVLFDWFRGLPEKKLPDTVEEMEPLYRALGHGCKAGRFRTAKEEVYQRRIQRGRQGYTVFQLGAVSSALAALAGFFPDGWDAPPVAADAGRTGECLSEADRSWLMAEAAFCLMSLGRLEEALGPRRVDWQWWKDAADWTNFCVSSYNLADLYTPLGRWREAEAALREAAEAAPRIEDGTERWQRTREAGARLGRVLHGQGRLAEARAAFAEAEAVQGRNLPQRPTLESVAGYDYAQLLLEQADEAAGWREVLARGRAALESPGEMEHLRSQALDHCTIAFALAALGEPEAGASFDRAVLLMQRASAIYWQPPMFLARATWLRSRGDFAPAWTDHAAALAIARSGNMRSYLAECALLAGNLHLDQGEVPAAAAQYATATQLIHEDSYLRRLAELLLLKARLLHAQHDAGAGAALREAEARIRETGQWYFWRELRHVGREIGADDPGDCPG